MADNVATNTVLCGARFGGLKIGSVVPVDSQGSAVANTTAAVNGTNLVDLPTQFNALLVQLRAVGIIAT